MTVDELIQAIVTIADSHRLPPALQALWCAHQGNWQQAHEIVQDANNRDSAWVHAYLHRQEGDLSNARYWYRQAQKPPFIGDLEQEWQQIAQELLSKLPELQTDC